MRPHRPLITLLALGTAAMAQSRGLAADFNGDGYSDLAIGCPGDSVNGFNGAGSVTILYGGPTAFATVTTQTISEASFGALATPALDERFGIRLAPGDFNGDNYDDLAITASGERVAGLQWAGAVFIAYGSGSGLQAASGQVFHQDTKGIKDKVEPHETVPGASAETLGFALAAGDFDGDGRDDLAIGVNESLGKKNKSKPNAGAVHVLMGGASGLTSKGNRLITQDSTGVPGKSATDRLFGSALAAGDLDGDGIDDLAVGTPDYKDFNGTVTILRGKAGKGLSGKGAVVIDEAAAGGTPDLLNGNGFGGSLALGDFTATGSRHLVIGASLSDTFSTVDTGAVYVLTLAQTSLAIIGAQRFARGTPGLEGPTVTQSYFGTSFGVGDFNNDGIDDLAIGCPRDEVSGIKYTGSVNVLPGSSAGLTTSDLLLTQDVPALPDTSEYGDGMGDALCAGDFDADGDADLAIGLSGEHLAGNAWCGAVMIIEGSPATLLDYVQSRWIDKTHASIPGEPEDNDAFGSALGG